MASAYPFRGSLPCNFERRTMVSRDEKRKEEPQKRMERLHWSPWTTRERIKLLVVENLHRSYVTFRSANLKANVIVLYLRLAFVFYLG